MTYFPTLPILAQAPTTVPAWLTQTSAAGLLVIFGYLALKYFVQRDKDKDQTVADKDRQIAELNTQISTLHEQRRQDSLRTLEVLSDVTQVWKDLSGNQLGLEGSVGQLSRDVQESFKHLEGVVRETRPS